MAVAVPGKLEFNPVEFGSIDGLTSSVSANFGKSTVNAPEGKNVS
jgi:hypothetical protein